MDHKERAIRDVITGCNNSEIIELTSPERKIALGIMHDISDRKGFRQAFDGINSETIEEILFAWIMIAKVVIDGEV